MNLAYLISLCTLLQPIESLNFDKFKIKSTRNSSLARALNEIVLKAITVDIPTVNVMSPNSLHSFKLRNFKDDFLTSQPNSSGVLFRLEDAGEVRALLNMKRRNNILLVETFEAFTEMFSKVSIKTHVVVGFYAVVLINGELHQASDIFAMFWRLHMFHVIVIFEDRFGSVQVETFVPFNYNKCDDATPVRINQFKDGKFTNAIKNMFSNKMKNLHKCPVRVATSNESEPFVIVKTFKNGTRQLKGRDIALIESLAESLNFTIKYTFIGPEGYFFENGSADGPLKAVIDGVADLAVADLWLKGHRLLLLNSTVPYFVAHLIFVVPPGRSYTTYEKLVYPFSKSFWIAIFSCFVFAVLVIFFVKKSSLRIQNFVFGFGIQHPYLNMFTGFIGGTQKILPKSNFARYLLMMLLIYSLVIRAVYQGSFYHLLQSNERHKEVETIDEMIANDFTFYIFDYTFDLFKNTEKIASR